MKQNSTKKASIKSFAILKSLMMAVMLLVGINAWGQVTSTFTSEAWAVSNGEPTWTAAGTKGAPTYAENTGVTVKFKQNATSFTLTNSTIKNTGKISKVAVDCTEGATIEVKVGGTSMSTEDSKTFTTTSPTADNIVLTFSGVKNAEVTIKSIEVTFSNDLAISAANYATYYNSQYAYTMPVGVTGYIFDASQNKITAAYAAGDEVPADEALVLKGDQGNYTLNFIETQETKNTDNSLLGTDESKALEADANSYFYALTLNAASELNSVGFYWMNDDGSAFTNGAHKAYLKLAKTTNAPIKAFPFNDDATAITNAKSSSNNGVIYNIAGQRLNGLQKGVNIVNGKKVLNK